MLVWHLYDGNPGNALTRQLHQMLMVRENDGLSAATDFRAEVQCGRRTRVIKGLHNIIKDHGKRAWIAGETAIPGKTQSKIQLAHGPGGHTCNRDRIAAGLYADELLALGFTPDHDFFPFLGCYGDEGFFHILEHSAATFGGQASQRAPCCQNPEFCGSGLAGTASQLFEDRGLFRD